MNSKEQCKAVALRSGRILEDQKPKDKQKLMKETFGNSDDLLKEEEKKIKKDKEEEEKKKKKLPERYQPPLPFPQRFQKVKLDKQFVKFLEVFKRKLEGYETVALIEECSAVLQNKLPLKLKDPGSIFIPCLISNMNIDKALYDLGASVSLMPLSICQKLNVGELKSTTISLQLVDRSVKYPNGILQNISI
ncbi:uncharacterized protein LOC131174592 [Hevea brasiliensis]|uniref:uncharacterized protein LOC131174592 n=1 Tax=Hevea brasiliensis TaxID=3981 RepID=UPI0025CF09FB|nr:uncharacterized protein LOC131174592 [Hevea brasiliensis]